MQRREFLHGLGAATLALAAPAAVAQVPQPVMTMSGKDSNDAPFTLDRFANKVCLVSFFTAGCNLCTHDLKLMREFNFANRTKNFALIGVNLDKSRQDFNDYLKLIGLAIPAEQRFPLLWRSATDHHDNFGPIVREPTHFVLDAKHRLGSALDYDYALSGAGLIVLTEGPV
jgi:peroxiredoxin